MRQPISSLASAINRRPVHHAIRSVVVCLLIFLTLLLAGCTPPTPTESVIQLIVEVDGEQIALQAPLGVTTQAALQLSGVSLNNMDRLDPPSYTILANNDHVRVTRVKEAFTIEEIVIPFERQTVHNESLTEGKTLLVQRGVNGVEQVTHRQLYEDGIEIANSIFKTEVITEPLPEIVMVGVQKPFTPIAIPGKLVYLSAGNAWVMENSTSERRPVVTTGDLDGRVFSLSPKGDYLLFTRSEKGVSDAGAAENAAVESKINSLWAVSLVSENPRIIYLKVDNVWHFADWMPGKGLTIAYSTVEPRSTAPGWQANNDLHILTFATTGAIVKQDNILEANSGGVYGWWGTSFAWSADGSLLAYARPDGVGLVDINRKALVPLVDLLPFRTGSDWAWSPGIGWSPDQQALFLVTHAPKAGLEDQESSPWFDLSALPMGSLPLGSKNEPPSTGPLIPLVSQAGMFAYPSPASLTEVEGYKVAYLQAIFPEQSDSRRYRLATIDRDGSNREILFPSEDRQGLDPQRVIWSPNLLLDEHLWLAVNYQGNLWLVDSETGEAQQITGDGLISRFDWK